MIPSNNSKESRLNDRPHTHVRKGTLICARKKLYILAIIFFNKENKTKML